MTTSSIAGPSPNSPSDMKAPEPSKLDESGDIISNIIAEQNQSISDMQQMQLTMKQRIDIAQDKIDAYNDQLKLNGSNKLDEQGAMLTIMMEGHQSEVERCTVWKKGLEMLMESVSERQRLVDKLGEMIIGKVDTDGRISVTVDEQEIKMLKAMLLTDEAQVEKELRESVNVQLQTIQVDMDQMIQQRESEIIQLKEEKANMVEEYGKEIEQLRSKYAEDIKQILELNAQKERMMEEEMQKFQSTTEEAEAEAEKLERIAIKKKASEERDLLVAEYQREIKHLRANLQEAWAEAERRDAELQRKNEEMEVRMVELLNRIKQTEENQQQISAAVLKDTGSQTNAPDTPRPEIVPAPAKSNWLGGVKFGSGVLAITAVLLLILHALGLVAFEECPEASCFLF